MELLHFLRNWLTQHMEAVDKKVGVFMRQNVAEGGGHMSLFSWDETYGADFPETDNQRKTWFQLATNYIWRW